MLEHDVAQGGRILHGHMHEEVVDTRDMEHLEHAGDRDESVEERRDLRSGVMREADLDDRLQRVAESGAVETDAGVADHAPFPERADAVRARGLRESEAVRQGLVGDGRIAAQGREQLQVDLVELRFRQRALLGTAGCCTE
ncbi:Uncharacterised protein [Mycobacterium tuberculosis]|nr:Uncharacterised protein [Mycobacterium tuberculosis]